MDMSTATEPTIPEYTVTFGEVVSKAVERTAEGLLPVADGRVDDPAWVAAARDAWHHLPVELKQPVGRFRRDSGDHGVLRLSGLPVGGAALPDTPTTPDSIQRETSVSAAVLMMVACGLGDPAAFRAEKLGALVQNVVPVPGNEDVQGNSGSVLLSLHNENAFHQHRPDFVMLLCLRTDHEGTAGLRTACIRQALPLLSSVDRDALSSDEFVTNPPPSFGAQSDTAVVHPVLSGDAVDPDVRVDFAATTPQTGRAKLAMSELQQAFETVGRTTRLQPGELAIVDNRVTVHGRTAYTPRYDGRDRWLQRTFVLADLRRSRRHRPNDSNVLAR
jgi:L-asparagine oxygenase